MRKSPPKAESLRLDAEARAELERAAYRRGRELNRQRARAVLMHADGARALQIAEELKVSDRSVRNWINAYRADGLHGLTDKRRSPRTNASASEERQELMRHVPKLQSGRMSRAEIETVVAKTGLSRATIYRAASTFSGTLAEYWPPGLDAIAGRAARIDGVCIVRDEAALIVRMASRTSLPAPGTPARLKRDAVRHAGLLGSVTTLALTARQGPTRPMRAFLANAFETARTNSYCILLGVEPPARVARLGDSSVWALPLENWLAGAALFLRVVELNGNLGGLTDAMHDYLCSQRSKSPPEGFFWTA